MNTQTGHTHSLPRNGPIGGPGTDAAAPLGVNPVAAAVGYGVFGLAWIAVAGLLRTGVGAGAGGTFVTISALAFVAASALLIYGLLRRTQSTLARRSLRRSHIKWPVWSSGEESCQETYGHQSRD